MRNLVADSPLSPSDIDYFSGHYSGLLAYALAERLGWDIVYYSVDGENRWRAATVQAPNGSELDARGFVRRATDFGVDRRIANADDIRMLRSYYEKTTVRPRIDAAADSLAGFAEPGLTR